MHNHADGTLPRPDLAAAAWPLRRDHLPRVRVETRTGAVIYGRYWFEDAALLVVFPDGQRGVDAAQARTAPVELLLADVAGVWIPRARLGRWAAVVGAATVATVAGLAAFAPGEPPRPDRGDLLFGCTLGPALAAAVLYRFQARPWLRRWRPLPVGAAAGSHRGHDA